MHLIVVNNVLINVIEHKTRLPVCTKRESEREIFDELAAETM